MKALNGKSYPWLEQTGQVWKHDLEGYIGIFGAASFGILVLSLVVTIFVKNAWLLRAILMALYIAFGFISVLVYYYSIRCPRCGHNPTRKKAGGWASSKYLEGKFRKMTSCPKCGDEGSKA